MTGSNPDDRELIIEQFASVWLDGSRVERTRSRTADGWEDIAIFIPAGEHEVQVKLESIVQRYAIFRYYSDGTLPPAQAWLGAPRIQSPAEYRGSWLADHGVSGPGDSDGDGVSDEMEFRFGTSPADSSDRPARLEVRPGEVLRGAPARWWLMVPLVPSRSSAVLESSGDLLQWRKEDFEIPAFRGLPPLFDLNGTPPFSDRHEAVLLPMTTGASRYYRIRFPGDDGH